MLFGVHCFFIHPITVAVAWTRLYSFPLDPRIWLSFLLHDIGYIGCTDMDGPSGRNHPYLGAQIMGFLFGHKWADFTGYHSRAIARDHNSLPSPLCLADKLAWAIEPYWLYLPRAYLSGEIHEYMSSAKGHFQFTNAREWYTELQAYAREVVADMQSGGSGKWCSGADSRPRPDSQASDSHT